VELVLKATLMAMSVDYPKAHDVGEALERALKTKGIAVRDKTIRELKEISRKPAAERAPAFYYESEYSQEEAQQALSWAAKVMRFSKQMRKRLQGG
jgi:HEPN domain-containing protein